MKKIIDFLDNFEEKIITIILPLMVIVVFMATFFRYTGLANFPWAEELSRYLMIWIVFLGIGVGAKRNQHFTVDNFVSAMPASTHKYFFILRTTIIVGFSGFMLVNAGNLIMRLQKMGQTTPALHIPTWMVYSAVPVGLFLLIIRSLQYAIVQIRREKEIKSNID